MKSYGFALFIGLLWLVGCGSQMPDETTQNRVVVAPTSPLPATVPARDPRMIVTGPYPTPDPALLRDAPVLDRDMITVPIEAMRAQLEQASDLPAVRQVEAEIDHYRHLLQPGFNVSGLVYILDSLQAAAQSKDKLLSNTDAQYADWFKTDYENKVRGIQQAINWEYDQSAAQARCIKKYCCGTP